MRLHRLVFTWTSIVAWALGCGGTIAENTSGSGSGGTSATSSASASSSKGSSSGSAGPGDGGVGAPCTVTESCADAETCVMTVPGGYCTVTIAECSADPFAPGFCPTGAWCVNGIQFGEQAGDFCMKICAGGADCREGEGYKCCPWGDAGVCYYGQGCP